MYCSKCKKEISDSSKFCKYCGSSISNNMQNTNINNDTNNKYRIHRYYGIIVFGIFITILIFHPKIIMDFPAYKIGDFLLDIIEHFDTFLFEIFGCIFFLGAIVFSTSELLFKCPNCKEDIKLTRNKLEDINDTIQTCKCPKCNQDLVFNTTDKTVSINVIAHKEEEITHSTTSKLEELYNLKSKGIITEEEFESKKKEYLDKM